MLISDARPGQATYAVALDRFAAAHVSTLGAGGILQSYAAVRQMPYFSGPDRTPLAALQAGHGACTAKHIILRDLLRRVGARAVVDVVQGDFAAAIPLHPSQPAALQTMIRLGDIADFHCRVRLTGPQGDQLLDATWPNELAAFGFAVNRDWTGTGNTLQAIPGAVLVAQPEDVLTTKARLLAGLEAGTAQRRLDFLRLLSGWLAQIGTAET